MDGVDQLEYRRHKDQFNIEVDEAAPHFPQWLKVFLLMMEEAALDNSLSWPDSRLSDCCIVCSQDETDLNHAERFRSVLNSHGFIACVLQESLLGAGPLLDEVQEMLDGTTVVFVLCTSSLLRDRGVAKLAFQDQLQTHINPEALPGKKIVPVTLPPHLDRQEPGLVCESRDDGASTSQRLRASSDCLTGYKTVSRRKLPFGLSLFTPIPLRNPDTYMKQVRRFISHDEQRRVRSSEQLETERRRLVQGNLLRMRQQEAVEEAVKIFKTVTCKEALVKFEHSLRKEQLRVAPRAMMDITTDGAGITAWSSPINRSFAGGPIGLASAVNAAGVLQGPEQLIDMSNCSNISIGTSYHFHVLENTAL